MKQLITSLAKLMEIYDDSWFKSFLTNVAVYFIVIIPGWLLIKYYKRSVQQGRNVDGFGPFSKLLKCCILGDPVSELEIIEAGGIARDGSKSPEESSNRFRSSIWRSVQLCGCISGLQVSYVTWGVMQERVITKSYNGDTFTESQFLVFANRVLALAVSGMLILFLKHPRHIAPFYKYSYSSFSNIISSWCQYEALKFISFPTQVLAKSCKVIPVMIMGKIVSNKTYPLNEYVTAIMISMGVSLFLLTTSSTSDKHHNQTEIAGIIILCGYLIFDSFTSNWQSELFKEYKMSSIQMMFGTNFFSFIFTSVSLTIQGTLYTSLVFLVSHLEFSLHVLVLSLCSAIGQLFIFYTVSSFGPVIFTLVMTSRQAISIIVSCIVYGHALSAISMVGVVIVFAAILLRVHFKRQEKK